MNSLMYDAQRFLGQLDREHWIAIFVGALVIGAFLLRGFGSRTGY